MVDTESVQDRVATLKRNGQHAEAVTFLTELLEQGEKESIQNGFPVSSWPYEQLAIIARKEKRHLDEIDVIERYMQLPGSGSKRGQKLIGRLPRAYQNQGLVLNSRDEKFLRKALFVDVETTGLSNRDEVIEIGMILVVYSVLNGEILNIESEYSGLRQPTIKIPPAATAKHGITDQDVRGKRLDESRIMALLEKADIVIAHNASYDYRMLEPIFPIVTTKKWYCTLNGISWRNKGCSERRLEYLLDYFGIAEVQNHRANEDISNTVSLLRMIDTTTQRPFFYELIYGRPVQFRSKADSDLRMEVVFEISSSLKLPWWKRLLGLK